MATGSGSTYFGHEDWRTFAPPMKILEHAEEIRRRLLMAMEQAEQTPICKPALPANRGDCWRWPHRLRDGRCHIATDAQCHAQGLDSDPADTRIVVVDPGERVLRAMPEQLSEAAQTSLSDLGVVSVQRPGAGNETRRGDCVHPTVISACKPPL